MLTTRHCLCKVVRRATYDDVNVEKVQKHHGSDSLPIVLTAILAYSLDTSSGFDSRRRVCPRLAWFVSWTR